MIKKEFLHYTDKVEVEISGDKAIVFVPERDISRVIGAKGKTITEIEKKLGIRIEIKELKSAKESIEYDFDEDKKNIRFFVEPGRDVDIYVDDEFLFSAISSKKGEIKVHKQSNFGRYILRAINKDLEIEVRA